jgi:hypothetical protein
MEVSDEHSSNAADSMRESFEPDSNVISESQLQPEKQESPSLSRDDGIQIDVSDEQASNTRHSIHETLDSDSNVI